MVIVQKSDSVYVAADTIYSGLMKDLAQMKNGYISAFDTVKGKQVLQVDSLLANDSTVAVVNDSLQIVTDSIAAVQQKDSIAVAVISPPVAEKPKPLPVKDSVIITKPPVLRDQPVIVQTDSLKIPLADSNLIAPVDTTVQKRIRPKEELDTIRFITAFRNVRIFNDSLQATSDSLFYSGVDSVFELYHNPIAWSKGSQVSGDTIFVFTENKKPKRMYVFENGLLVQNVKETAEFFNQIKGRTINAYFMDGELDFVKAKGTAESIYYAQDDDSAYVGMNRTTADMIDIYFKDRSPQKIKYSSSVKGTTYPIRQLPDDQKKLSNFQWLESKRPKSKLELFL